MHSLIEWHLELEYQLKVQLEHGEVFSAGRDLRSRPLLYCSFDIYKLQGAKL